VHREEIYQRIQQEKTPGQESVAIAPAAPVMPVVSTTTSTTTVAIRKKRESKLDKNGNKE
jgi:hypothetical protein